MVPRPAQITRKTDKRLLRYDDANSDIFMLSGAEDLVPVLVQVGGKWQPPKNVIPHGGRKAISNSSLSPAHRARKFLSHLSSPSSSAVHVDTDNITFAKDVSDVNSFC